MSYREEEPSLPLIVSSGAKVTALDRRNGETIWKTDIAAGGRPALLLDGDRLIIAAHGAVECHAIDGRRMWATKVAKQGSVSMAVGDRVAYDDREG